MVSANDETMSATPPMSHPTRPGLDDLPDPPAAPRKKKPTRSRVFPAPADDDDAATTPAASRRRLVFGDGGEFDSPEGGGGGAGARGARGGTRTPASPPMTREGEGGKEPKTLARVQDQVDAEVATLVHLILAPVANPGLNQCTSKGDGLV